MIKNLQKIVVVGGGSAGWMSASFLKKALPDKEVIVIESPNIPTIGVGESTLGSIKTYLNFLEIDEFEFMRATDASYKMSIKFTNFCRNDGTGFHYPFGQPFEEGTVNGISDWLLIKARYPNIPVTDFVQSFFPASFLFENNRFALNHDRFFDNYNPSTDVAYHFDAVKFASYLRTKYSKILNIKHILGTVVDYTTSENGVDTITLDDGSVLAADLFVDCTGFRSLLIGEALKQTFNNFNHLLPNNRAWAAQVPYKNKLIELEGFTNCTAIKHGWVWNTPVWSRLGTGYVYSDKYIDPENAKKEFKQYLMNDMLCKRSEDEVDSLTFRDIPIRVGCYQNTFVKNVVAIGMSAGFIEPLESNGLFTVHEFLFKLIQILNRDVVSQFEIDLYNSQVYSMWTGFAHFVANHFKLSQRTDTDYWLDNLKRSNNNQPSYDIFDENVRYLNDLFNNNKFERSQSGINYIAIGMEWFYVNKVVLERFKFLNYDLSKIDSVANLLQSRKNKWNHFAFNSPTLLDYQKTHIYGEA